MLIKDAAVFGKLRQFLLSYHFVGRNTLAARRVSWVVLLLANDKGDLELALHTFAPEVFEGNRVQPRFVVEFVGHWFDVAQGAVNESFHWRLASTWHTRARAQFH